jgi:Uma2 family endonuclease
MSLAPTETTTRRIPTAAALLRRLGDIDPERVRMVPPPGTATEADVIRFSEKDDTVYELVDGTLVEKAMGWGELDLESWLLGLVNDHLKEHDIGRVFAGAGMIRLGRGKVRGPDLTVLLWHNVPTPEENEKNPIARTVPDFVVEVISRSNTPKEMTRKRKEYFAAGTTIVWQVYPKTKTVEVYASPARFKTLGIDDTLDGGSVMPNFRLSVRTLFSPPTKPGTQRKK